MSDLRSDVDMLWTIAEAFARARQNEDAVNMFKRILSSTKDPQIRVATIQKALGALAHGRCRDPACLRRLARPRDRKNLRRSRSTSPARASPPSCMTSAPRRLPPPIWRNSRATRRSSRDANQLGLVAWYDYKRRDFNGALEWFKLAIQYDGDAMIAHGLAHSLRALNMKREAEEVAYAWREPLVNNMILLSRPARAELTRRDAALIEADRLARYAKVTMEAAPAKARRRLPVRL